MPKKSVVKKAGVVFHDGKLISNDNAEGLETKSSLVFSNELNGLMILIRVGGKKKSKIKPNLDG